MADSRTKTHSILLTVNSKKTVLELFDAELWPDQNTGAGLYRVRVDGRWHSPMGKYTFLPIGAVMELAGALLAGGEPVTAAAAPEGFDRPCRVRVQHGDCCEGMPLHSDMGWTCAPPHLGADGRWYLWVRIADGCICVPARDVERAEG